MKKFLLFACILGFIGYQALSTASPAIAGNSLKIEQTLLKAGA